MRYTFFILLPAIFFSCQSGHSDTKHESTFRIDSVKTHIIKMNESYSERFTTNDTAYYNSRYCKDAQVYSPGMPAVIGRDSIISFFYQNGTNKEAKIELPAGNIYGTENLLAEEGTYNFPDGKGGSFDKGKFIALWKQEDGKWKLFREIWNTDNAQQPATK
jgi:ketosteroid isomerase-like protein